MKIHLFTLLLAACLLCTACGKTETPPLTENTTSADTTEASQTTLPPETAEATLPPASGGSGPCSTHNELYHSFPDPWIAYVGRETFYQWIEQTSPTQQEIRECTLHDVCPYAKQNIYAFIHSMSYPKAVFIEQYNTDPWVDLRYNIDLLYGEDPAAAEEYYLATNSALEEMRMKITALRTAKHKLRNAFLNQLGDDLNWKEHSLLEMLELVGNDPDDIRALTDAAAQYGLSLHFDRIEAMDADEREALTAHSAFYQDCVLLGETPYETPYEKQVADNEETARIKKERGLDLCAQICCAHNLLYHSYFDPWIAYVGADTLEAWSNAEILAHYPSTVECPYPTANVYNFIHTFNYPKERFIEDFNTVLGIEYDYPVDLLYGDDPAAVERYFAELVDRHTKMEEDAERLGDWKYDLRQQYPEQFRDYYNWKQHSLLEMLTASGADLSDAKALNETAAQYGLQLRFDTIAAMDADALTALTAHSAFWQDCVLLGETPYETPYEKQVADNAAQ